MRAVSLSLFAATAAIAGSASAQIGSPVHYDPVSHDNAVAQTGQSDVAQIRTDPFDRMTVQVKVGGRGPYNFLVDTGADHTVISSSIARSLELDPAKPVRLYTVSGNQQVETASVGQIEFSRKTLQNVNAAVLDRSNLGADGILGIDSLRSERVTFDFPKGLMTIVSAREAEQRVRDRETVVVNGRLKAGRLILTNASAGRKPINVVIDTGSDASIGNPALRRRLWSTGLLHPVGLVQLRSVTGHAISGELMTLDEFRLGEVVIRKMAIVFTDAPIFETLKLHDRPSLLLGMDTIRAFERVSIDFANRKFRVVLPRTSSIEDYRLAAL